MINTSLLVAALLGALHADQVPRRRADWMQRDRALTLTALLAGMRADELLRANVGDLRRSDDGAIIHVRGKGGKGGKNRRMPDPDRAGIGAGARALSRRPRDSLAGQTALLPRRGIGRLAIGGAAICGRPR
jgi:integrase